MNKRDRRAYQREYQRKYYRANKERSRKWHRDYYEKNKKHYQERWKKQRIELREWMNAIKAERGCLHCPENAPAKLVFHHRDPSNKKDYVPYMVWARYPKKTILDEIKKCDILCMSCHTKLHHKLRRKNQRNGA